MPNVKSACLTFACALGALAAAASCAHAATFSASSGSLAASADFTASGNNLTITLTNTSTADTQNPADVLTAVFFDYNGATLALTPVSATLANGSTFVYLDPLPGPIVANAVAAGNVGGEWGYGSGLSGAPGAAAYGISSSGFTLFGAPNFNGPNLAPPPA